MHSLDPAGGEAVGSIPGSQRPGPMLAAYFPAAPVAPTPLQITGGGELDAGESIASLHEQLVAQVVPVVLSALSPQVSLVQLPEPLCGTGGGAGLAHFLGAVDEPLAGLATSRRNKWTFATCSIPAEVTMRAAYDAVRKDLGESRNFSLAALGVAPAGGMDYILCVYKDDKATLTFPALQAMGGLVKSVYAVKGGTKPSVISALTVLANSVGAFMSSMSMQELMGTQVSWDYMKQALRPLSKDQFDRLQFLINQLPVTTIA